MKKLLPFILILIGSYLAGQDMGMVRGTVYDASSGEPMVAVNISANRRSGTISGQDGEFSLTLTPGDLIIEFYYVGY